MIFPIQNKKKVFIAIAVVVFLVLVGVGAYFYLFKKQKPIQQNQPQTQITHLSCLGDDEYVDYPLDPKYDPSTKLPKLPIIISIKDKNTNKERFKFQIENVRESYHPLEIHKCGIYVVRQFNYDSKKTEQDPGYKKELWKYNYSGNEELLLLLAEKPKEYISYYNDDFRIDATEFYVFLIKSYLGNDDYSLVVKDLNTKEDVYVLTLKYILEKYSNINPGSFGLGIFAPDNQYFWGDLYVGPYETASYRIKLGTWETDILSSPPNLPSGAERAWNFTGWLAYADITSFTGIDEITKQIEEEAVKEGKMKNLWIYNMFTKETEKITTVDPSWRFQPQWLSDSELKYLDPQKGEVIYKVQ
ncbi:MAG: hypothetical protein UV72_C0016G0002 [Candidatus Giovannonibacteria bacterium GW2011_GWB1_43_13]|nr:MAG: hypothetical protein UV72_C0016G0002 [Candidatus Giovannonibacteria bacterium GW2011_GWB1_43_13]